MLFSLVTILLSQFAFVLNISRPVHANYNHSLNSTVTSLRRQHILESKKHLARRAEIAFPADFQQIHGFDDFWAHQSCYNLSPDKVDRIKQSFESAKELIESTTSIVDEIVNAWHRNEPPKPPCDKYDGLQRWIRNICPPFEQLFSEGRLRDFATLLEWQKGWVRMNNLIKPGRNPARVLVTCFESIYSVNHPDVGELCEGAYAFCASAGRLVSPSLQRRDFNFAEDQDVKMYQVINLCPGFFGEAPGSYAKLSTPADLLYKVEIKKERLGRYDLSSSMAGTLVHELAHLKKTFYAPYGDSEARHNHDPVNDDQIREATKKGGVGFRLTYQYAELNAQFASWCHWYKEKRWWYMSWDGGAYDKTQQRVLRQLDDCWKC